ncbi:hypothetical protein D3C80_1361620 [compost metagenome]
MVVDQEGITHTAEVQRVDDFHQAIQRQIAPDHTDAAGDFAEDADDHLVGGQIDIGLGEHRAVGAHTVLVPGAGARIIAVGHLGVWTNTETAIDLAQVDGEKARDQGVLAHQRLSVGWVLGNVLCQVFHQTDPPLQQVADIGGRRGTHFCQVVFQINARRITLEVVAVQGEQGKGEHHDQ